MFFVLIVWYCLLHSSSGTHVNDRCFTEVGCFPITKDFLRRLTSPAVEPREKVNTKFTFFSSQSEIGKVRAGHKLSAEELLGLPFDANKETKIIVHGWLDNIFLGSWMTTLKDELQRLGGYNVILVDWTDGNGLPYYQATVNTRLVGAEIGLLVLKLQNLYKINASAVHIYGHSLGAHAAGYAGKWLNGTLGRITALDPAEPLFENMPVSVRLDRSDAWFVEAIHTDGRPLVPQMGLGMKQAIGHIDFYPNGGLRMPGCNLKQAIQEIRDKSFVENIRKFTACNHMRAIDYAVAFVKSENDRNSACVPIAYACKSYELFERGHCSSCGPSGDSCAIVNVGGGEYARRRLSGRKSNESLKFYFKTGENEPYCLFHYNIVMKLSGIKTHKSASGSISISFELGKDSLSFQLDNGGRGNKFTPGALYRFVIASEKPLLGFRRLQMIYKADAMFLAPALDVEYMKITPMTTNDVTRKPTPNIVCPSGPLYSRSNLELRTAYCQTRASRGV